MTPAERRAAWKARDELGLVVLPVEADEIGTTELLIARGFLVRNLARDPTREELASAASAFLAHLVAVHKAELDPDWNALPQSPLKFGSTVKIKTDSGDATDVCQHDCRAEDARFD